MNLLRNACCLLLFTTLSYAVSAQTPCAGGSAAGYPCNGIDLMSYTPLSVMNASLANDLWGWTSPNTGDEYVILGLINGTAFFNISDPVNPTYLGKLPTQTGNSDWRDVKVYNNHAFIVSEASGHGMQVFNLLQLDGVTTTQSWSNTAYFNGAGNGATFGSAHNIVINEGSGYAYVVGAGPCNGGLLSIDISNPTNPSFAGCFSTDGYTHDAQCVNYIGPDPQYQGTEICLNSNANTLTIVDVTDKTDMTQVSRTGYSGVGYTHQGWLTEDHQYYLMNDEFDESNNGHNTRTYIWDLRDLDNPVYLGFYQGSAASIDHNLYIKDNLAYCSNYSSGLRVLDVSNIASGSLTEFAYFDTYPSNNSSGFDGTWSNYPYFASGVIAVSGIENSDAGLFLLKLQNVECLDGVQNNGETGVDCGGVCEACPTCNDGIQNGDEAGIDCGGTNCAVCPPCNGVTLTLNTDDYASETTWSILDANGNQVASGGGYGTNNSTFIENECIFDGCYDFVINDSYGDGICCGFGNGSYTLTDASGNVLASGGQFTDTETTNFCFDAPTCAGVDLDINFDNSPTQTSWEITDASGAVVASSGGNVYGTSLSNSNLSLPNITCLPDGCYDLNFYDSVNNGMCPFRATASSGGTFITPGTLIVPGSFVATLGTVVAPSLCGNYTLTDANGTVLASGGGSFGATDSNNFCVNGGVASLTAPGNDNLFSKEYNDGIISDLQIQPNIVQDKMTVVYTLEKLANAELFIIDINGKTLKQYTQNTDSEQRIEMNVSELSSGFYFIKLVSGDVTVTRKFVKQ